MNEIILFGEKQVRRVRFQDEWWFVIRDVVSILTQSVNPSDYLKKLRKRDESLSDIFKGGGQIVPPLGFIFAKDTYKELEELKQSIVQIAFNGEFKEVSV